MEKEREINRVRGSEVIKQKKRRCYEGKSQVGGKESDGEVE